MEENVTDLAVPARRFIAISYRDKEVMRDGVVIEQRPTMALVIDGEKTFEIKFPDEDHEMCFLRAASATIPSDKPNGKPTIIDFTESGIRVNDTVLMVMGGSGAFYSFALSKKLEALGRGGVSWIGSTLFKRLCDEYHLDRSKLKSVDDEGRRTEITFDHHALPKLFEISPSSFHLVTARERDLILLNDVLGRRIEAMKARMACAHRVRQRMKKLAYCVLDAYPEGGIKVFIEQGVANDKVLALAVKEENSISLELKKLLHSLPVWRLFESIEGVGELTAAPLIAAIGDINRFPSEGQLKAFLGMHTLRQDGQKFGKGEYPQVGNSIFARRRQGQLSNWNHEGRQALYLISVQFLQWRKESPWGLVAQAVKLRMQAAHPSPQVWQKSVDEKGKIVRKVDLIPGACKRVQGGWEVTHMVDGVEVTEVIKGVTKYNPAHINKMTGWRTMTKFVELLYRAWKATEAGKELPALPYQEDVGKLKIALALVANVSDVQKVA